MHESAAQKAERTNAAAGAYGSQQKGERMEAARQWRPNHTSAGGLATSWYDKQAAARVLEWFADDFDAYHFSRDAARMYDK